MINALGLENGISLRKVFDGFTYFGCKKSIKNQASKSQFSPASPQPQLKVMPGHGQSTASNGGFNGHMGMGATGTSNEEATSEIFEVQLRY
jgi:hypothetical protein